MREPEKETEAEGGEGGNKWWYDNREDNGMYCRRYSTLMVWMV